MFADEVAAALGFESLPEESPPRDEQLFGLCGLCVRKVGAGSYALSRNLVATVDVNYVLLHTIAKSRT